MFINQQNKRDVLLSALIWPCQWATSILPKKIISKNFTRPPPSTYYITYYTKRATTHNKNPQFIGFGRHDLVFLSNIQIKIIDALINKYILCVYTHDFSCITQPPSIYFCPDVGTYYILCHTLSSVLAQEVFHMRATRIHAQHFYVVIATKVFTYKTLAIYIYI